MDFQAEAHEKHDFLRTGGHRAKFYSMKRSPAADEVNYE
jgi:hypothetical protein